MDFIVGFPHTFKEIWLYLGEYGKINQVNPFSAVKVNYNKEKLAKIYI